MLVLSTFPENGAFRWVYNIYVPPKTIQIIHQMFAVVMTHKSLGQKKHEKRE